MKKQVISNIVEILDTGRNVHARNVKLSHGKVSKAYYKGLANGFELAIRTCLEEADILDLRPKHRKLLFDV